MVELIEIPTRVTRKDIEDGVLELLLDDEQLIPFEDDTGKGIEYVFFIRGEDSALIQQRLVFFTYGIEGLEIGDTRYTLVGYPCRAYANPHARGAKEKIGEYCYVKRYDGVVDIPE